MRARAKDSILVDRIDVVVFVDRVRNPRQTLFGNGFYRTGRNGFLGGGRSCFSQFPRCGRILPTTTESSIKSGYADQGGFEGLRWIKSAVIREIRRNL